MDFTMRFINVALEGYSIVICCILIGYHLFHMDTYKSQKQWFCCMLLTNMFMMLGDITDWLFNGVETPAAFFLAQYGMCLFYGASGLLLLTLTGYLIEFLELYTRTGRWIKTAAIILAGVQMVLAVSSRWTGLYFYYTDRNVYVRGPIYLLSQIIPLIMYIMDAALIVIGRKKLRFITAMFLSSYIIFPLIGQILQIFFYGGAYINVMATVAMLLVNTNVQNEQENKMKEREKEPIPFDRELEHVKHYLNLEQQRFGKRLTVVYDIGCREFLIPTLTLQPIVENAVRHGILKRAEGGTVTIHTEEQKDACVIVVTDTGAGLWETDEASDDSSHIGLDNVGHRLQIQCRGKLTFKSGENGTAVTIWLPKEKGG